MVTRLSQLKTNMQKSPITIEEDLADLERQSEEELTEIMKKIELFFASVTVAIDAMLNPKRVID